MSLEALVAALGLKDLPRAGWVRRGIDTPESVAAHSHGVALLVLSLLPPDLDRERALRFAILHDLPEIKTGDLTPHDLVTPQAKREAEEQAMRALCKDLPGGQAMLQDWLSYERQACPESRFVRQLDRLDMALQAVAYAENQGVDTTEFVRSALEIIDHTALRALALCCLSAVSVSQEPPSQPPNKKPLPSNKNP